MRSSWGRIAAVARIFPATGGCPARIRASSSAHCSLPGLVRDLVVADFDHCAGKPARPRMPLKREVDAVGRRIGLVDADVQPPDRSSAAISGARKALVVVMDDADLPGPGDTLVDRREGMDRNQPGFAAGARARSISASIAAWNGCQDERDAATASATSIGRDCQGRPSFR